MLVMRFVLAILFLLPCQWLMAQCTGNVLFLENFGGTIVPPFTGAPLPPGTTSYRFDSLGVIDDGEYGIRRSTAHLPTGAAMFGSWHVGFDHSGGHMMMINADPTPGKFYETRVGGLCSGSQLYFSAWIANLLRAGTSDPLDPVVRFEISSAITGTVLATYTTPAIPRFNSFTWTRYGFNFSLPSGESEVILRIFNNQPGGQGNDLCLDDIEFTLCGPAINPTITGSFQGSDEACAGARIEFNGNVAAGFYQNEAYQWQFSTDGFQWNNINGARLSNLIINNAQLTNSGFYRLLVAEAVNINSANCRAVSPVQQLRVFNPVPATITGSSLVCERDTIRLLAPVNALQYNWLFNGSTVSSDQRLQLLNVNSSNSGLYQLQLVTNGGCSTSSSVNITVQSNRLIPVLPNYLLLCDGAATTVNGAAAPATSFLWNDGITTPNRSLSRAGTYVLTSADGVCRRTDTLVVETNNRPRVQLPADTVICFSETIVIDATTPLATSYSWSNNENSPSITIQSAGLYTVTATNNCGSSSDAIAVRVEECTDEVYVPSAFTPNNDALNDLFLARAFFRIDGFQIRVFDRWGREVFRSTDITKGWDGLLQRQPATPGTYVWMLEYSRNGRIKKRNGTVQLIR